VQTVAEPLKRVLIPSATGCSEPRPPGRSRRRMRVYKTWHRHSYEIMLR
jgi:hypothetical protein